LSFGLSFGLVNFTRRPPLITIFYFAYWHTASEKNGGPKTPLDLGLTEQQDTRHFWVDH
jgi:hypothetical protein